MYCDFLSIDNVSEPKVLKIDQERYDYWLSVGAKPSEKVAKLAAK